MFREVILPGALPTIITGLSIGMGTSWFCLVTAEMIAGQYGIGYYTWESYNLQKYPDIVVGMMIIGVFGMLSSALIKHGGALLMPWYRPSPRDGRRDRDSRAGAGIDVRGLTVTLGGCTRRSWPFGISMPRIQPGEFVVHPRAHPAAESRRCWARSPASSRRARARSPSTASRCAAIAFGRTSAWCFSSTPYCPGRPSRTTSAFGLKMRGVARTERRAAARDLLAQVGLSDFARAYPAQLSGGMQQRVEIARVLITQPRVLLMDEPFGSLDAQTRLAMQELLLAIWARVGVTVVFVTHDIDEAIFLGDRILVMSHRPGRIREVLPVEFDRPRAPEIATTARFAAIKRRCLGLLREEPLFAPPVPHLDERTNHVGHR